MATTTPNFGWPVPTSTDLVKDGATAIEALGDGIDTSMVDLKGGLTGQVLSKTTNADMDFTWVTTDDANAIQNSIVDAKGDLIGATANDTPARLAVGANDTMLVADSTAATGLAYKSATTLYPWAAYTFTPNGLTVGNGTLTARYQQIGKTVFAEVDLVWGSTTSITAGIVYFGLPVAAKLAGFTGAGMASYGDAGVGNYTGTATFATTTSFYLGLTTTSGTYAFENVVTATTPMTWTTNDRITARLTYEEA